MRRVIVIATVVATGLASISPVPGFAQTVGSRSTPATASIDPMVVATINAFPEGGQALTDRIRTMVLQNSDLARDVARYLTSKALLSGAQRDAVEKGLAEALTQLGIYAQVRGYNPDPYGWLVALAMLGVGIGAGVAAGRGNNNAGPLVLNQPPPPVTPH